MKTEVGVILFEPLETTCRREEDGPWLRPVGVPTFSLPFMVVARMPAMAIALSAVTLFAVGVYSAKTLVGDWRKSGLQMVAIGIGAAALAFLIGRLVHIVGC